MAPNLKKMLIIFITGKFTLLCIMECQSDVTAVDPSLFKSCLYFANCICQFVRIQGRNWLPKTGWASKMRHITIFPNIVWVIAHPAQCPSASYAPFYFLPRLCDSNSQNQGLENNGLIDTSYLVFKYAMVGRAF